MGICTKNEPNFEMNTDITIKFYYQKLVLILGEITEISTREKATVHENRTNEKDTHF